MSLALRNPHNGLNTVRGNVSTAVLNNFKKAKLNLNKTNASRFRKLILNLVMAAICFALVSSVALLAASGTETVQSTVSSLAEAGYKYLGTAIRVLEIMKHVPQAAVNAGLGAASSVIGNLSVPGRTPKQMAMKAAVVGSAYALLLSKIPRGNELLTGLKGIKNSLNSSKSRYYFYKLLNSTPGRVVSQAILGKSTLDLYFELAKALMKYAIQIGGAIGISVVTTIRAYKKRRNLPSNLRALGNMPLNKKNKLVQNAIGRLLNNNRRPATARINVTRNNAVLGFPVTRRVRRPSSAR